MEICTVGGFEEVGKNMTALKVGDDVMIFDAGLFIPGIVELQEENVLEYANRLKNKKAPNQNTNKKNNQKQQGQYSEKQLRSFGAIPDDRVLNKLGWNKKVRAIFISHAHLDHVGGAPYILSRYPNVPVYGTPFTMEVLKTILQDEGIKINNPLKTIRPNSSFYVKGNSEKYKIDFIHTTHSTLQCVFIAAHTKEGVFFYAMDLKFDNYPTIGEPPNYKKFKEIGKEGVKIAIIDSLYSGTEEKTGGERIAQHMLQEAISKMRGKNSAFFVTTFSSHIERLINIVNLAKKTKREIVFLGRSLSKYVEAAKRVNAWPYKGKIKLVKYGKQRESFMRKLEKDRGKYFVICTGHQAEENSAMDRIVKEELPFKFREGDHVIFSSSIIPTPVNIAMREKMDKKLRRIGVRLQTGIHVHGHGSRDDMRDLIRIVKPKHIIPSHGDLQQEAPMIELASEFKYKFGETAHLSSNGKVLKL